MGNSVFIYALSHPVTLEVRYIGEALNIKRRLQSHIDYARNALKRRPVSDWIASLIKVGAKPIISIIEESSDSNWPSREMFWISQYKQQGARLLNLTDGGESNNGYKYSPELRDIRRKARIGYKTPDSVRDAIKATLSKKVVCVEDRVVYTSMKEAIKASGVPKSTFHRKMHKGESINNKTYQFYNPQTPQP